MRAVVQRVREARVVVANQTVGAIGAGLLIYLGISRTDGSDEPAWMAQKVATLRIFADASDRMTLAATQVGAELLVVSQFTLYGDVRKGRRPSFDQAAAPEAAEQRYMETCQALRGLGFTVATGQFRAQMEVHAVVDGPVTILIDSDRDF